MSNEITMPKLSDTMEEGKILRWLKHPGDQIHRGDAIAEVETDKADMVLEAFEDGVLEELKLKEGESAPVGAVIALMRAPGEASAGRAKPAEAPAAAAIPVETAAAKPAPPRAAEKAPAPAAKPAREPQGAPAVARIATVNAPPEMEQEETGPPAFHPAMGLHPSAAPTALAAPPRQPLRIVETPEVEHGGHKLRASPLARRAAEEAGIDLEHVRGTGPDGRITKRDVDNYLREQQMFKFRRLVHPHEGAPGSREELSRMRKTIAQRMALSKREIPHFYVTVEIDMDEAVRFKKSLETTELFEEDITYNDMIVKATALALGRFPRMNASFENDAIVIHPHVNIGVAVAIEDGLLLPVIRECERLTLPEIAAVSHRLVAKAGHGGGGFTTDELSGATFTISNMGMVGVEHFAAVIVPPQAAILAVSAIKEKPVVRNGQLAVGRTMMVTVSCDHRIIDGIVAGRFLQELKRFLENPASLLV
jgi:pyruvate dehydrogenase E2 component (dihydrolipoamide acetyltransferase)